MRPKKYKLAQIARGKELARKKSEEVAGNKDTSGEVWWLWWRG